MTESPDAELGSVASEFSVVPADTIPRFHFNLSRPKLEHYGCIVSGGKAFHRVGDFDEFYEALGYTKELRKAGLAHDEFLWERYRRDGAVKSAQCLQAHIVAYLHKHSGRFRELYGRAYDESMGTCSTDCIDHDDQHCIDCPKHPRFNAASVVGCVVWGW